jgi:hypothetical protein
VEGDNIIPNCIFSLKNNGNKWKSIKLF